MQNQAQYSQAFSTQNTNNLPSFYKLGSPNHLKLQDKTLPSPSIKNYASNPNLSLEVNNLKTSQVLPDTHAQAYSNSIKRNL